MILTGRDLVKYKNKGEGRISIMVKKPSKFLLALQAVIVIVGIIASIAVICTASASRAIAGAIVCILVDLYVVYYGFIGYKKGSNVAFKGLIYVYAALLGLLLLPTLIGNSNLPVAIQLLIFVGNLIAFANVIKFSDYLDKPNKAIPYLAIAVGIKLVIAIFIAISSREVTTLPLTLVNFQIPLIGGTILVSYCNRIGE